MSNGFTKIAGRIAVLGVLGFALAGCGINKIPAQDEQVKAAWSQVQNQYQRRADLVPALVATVKGYAKQEQTVFTQVTEARAKATQTVLPNDILSNPKAFQQFEQNQAQLGGALSRLLVTVEASWPCRCSSKGRRTVFPSRAATTSTPSAPTTPCCAPFRTAGRPGSFIPN